MYLADRDGNGGYTFHPSANWANVPGGMPALLSALDRWSCSSGAKWSVGANAADTTYAHDGEDRIIWKHDLGFRPYRIHRWFSLCAGELVLDEIDIEVNADKVFAAWPATPTSTQWDLHTVLMGALGHAVGLDEVIDTTSVMCYGLTAGMVIDGPSAIETAWAQQAVNTSQTITGCGLGPMDPAVICGAGYGLDAGLASILAPRPGYCAGVQPVVVNLSDPGVATITSATVHVSINGVEQPSLPWSGSLAHGESIDVELGDITLPSGTVSFSVWLSDVNGTTDEQQLNDTLVWSGTIGTCTSQALNITPGPAGGICTDEGFTINVQPSSGNGRPLKGCRIDHTVDGVPRPTIFWTGSINQGNTGSIFLGDDDVVPGVPHTLSVTINDPNGVETAPPGGTTRSALRTPTSPR
jgi:hypothetical protein